MLPINMLYWFYIVFEILFSHLHIFIVEKNIV